MEIVKDNDSRHAYDIPDDAKSEEEIFIKSDPVHTMREKTRSFPQVDFIWTIFFRNILENKF